MPKVTLTTLISALSLLTAGNLSAQSASVVASATVIDLQPARAGLAAAQLAASSFASPRGSAVDSRRDLPGAAVLASAVPEAADPLRRSTLVTLLYW